MGGPVKSDRVRGSEFEFQFPCSPEGKRLPRFFVFVLFFCPIFSLRVFSHAFRGSVFSSCYIKYTSHWVGVFSVFLSVYILVHIVRLLHEFSQKPHKNRSASFNVHILVHTVRLLHEFSQKPHKNKSSSFNVYILVRIVGLLHEFSQKPHKNKSAWFSASFFSMHRSDIPNRKLLLNKFS